MTVAAFLTDTAGFRSETVEAACVRLRQRGGFPPDSGALVKECAAIVRTEAKRARDAVPRLPSPPRGLSAVPPEDRDAVRARIKAMTDEFKRAVAGASIHDMER
jgi:hypothetical protein